MKKGALSYLINSIQKCEKLLEQEIKKYQPTTV